MSEITKWTKRGSENRCFKFQEHEAFEHPVIIILITIALVIGAYFIYCRIDAYLAVFVGFFLFILAFSLWATIPLSKNERSIEIGAYDSLKTIVHSEAAFANIAVESFCLYHNTENDGNEWSLLFLMNNKEIWEYPIIYHKSKGARAAYYECVITHLASKEEKHVKALRDDGKDSRRYKLPYSKRTIQASRLLFSALTGVASIFLFCWLYVALFRRKIAGFVALGIIVIYLVGYLILKCRLGDKKKGKVLFRILSIPISWLHLARPFIPLFVVLFLFSIVSFGAPFCVMYVLNDKGWLLFKPETMVFVTISVGSILFCSDSFMGRVFQCNLFGTILRDARKDLILYIMRPQNRCFVFYLLYLCLLAVSGYLQLQNGYLFSEVYDAAILKAFLVFMAFSNMIKRAQEVEADVAVLFKKAFPLDNRPVEETDARE